ncbi:hypothetical protein BKA80DRAFT_263467 [Phyllosticta citrichinensis]
MFLVLRLLFLGLLVLDFLQERGTQMGAGCVPLAVQCPQIVYACDLCLALLVQPRGIPLPGQCLRSVFFCGLRLAWLGDRVEWTLPSLVFLVDRMLL